MRPVSIPAPHIRSRRAPPTRAAIQPPEPGMTIAELNAVLWPNGGPPVRPAWLGRAGRMEAG
jgi:hypothetical protein